MKFKSEKTASLLGHTEVRLTLEGQDEEADGPQFSVVAGPQGIQFRGASPWIGDRDALDAFAQAVDRAWREHLKLKPTISKTISGH